MLSFIKRYQPLIAFIVLALLSLQMASTNIKGQGGSAIAGRVVSILTIPFQTVITYTMKGTRDIWAGYVYLLKVKEENDVLKETVARLREENHRLKEASLANERLREILSFKETTPLPFKGAEVIGIENSGWTRTAILDRGTRDGVLKDMVVITPLGIVGRVIEAHPGTSRVLLATDPRSNIDAIIQRTRVKGIVEGRGDDRLTLKYVRQTEDLQVGDIVISSGLGGVFPKGLAIGGVIKVEMAEEGFFKLVEVKPFVDFKKLEEILVVTK
ncbi:MAG: rod shape-determining protein MreC [Deltaproteobacteria bacterium]|nr:rod shape-determining protein MreC [Deltaproteobacteria bacterium]